MRPLIVKLVLWLCTRFDIVPLDETRKFLGTDKVARGQRWESFYTEEGGLADMIAAARKEAFEAYADCRPGDMAEKEYLAASDRCWRSLEQRVRSVIQTGKIEAENNRRRDQMAERPRLKSI